MIRIHRWSALGWGLVLTAGCSTRFQPSHYATPEALMEVSEDYFRHGKCTQATRGFQQVTAQVPARDSIGLRARFMLAECDYTMGNYLEAARNFRRIVDEAPADPLAPNALLRSGDAQAALWKRPELDPTYGDAALATYRELLARYPGTPAARRVGVKIRQLSRMQAAKVFKNGRFYDRLGAYDSAILYYKKVVADHGDSPEAQAALLRLVAIYRKLGYDEERSEICDHLRTYYPDAPGLAERCPTTTGAP